MNSMISASMMCSNLLELKETISIFEKQKVDYLHIDVMDGEFVPNFGLGVDYIRGLRELTTIPLDLHLMVKSPEYKIQWIGIKETDIVSIHYESTFQVQRTLDWLTPFKCKKFIAINPATPPYSIEEVLDYIDGVNILMVNPGFSGQKMVSSTIKKVEKTRLMLEEAGKTNIVIEVDGNITFERAKELKAMGASMFVAGTSSIFRGSLIDYQDNIIQLKKSIE